MSRLVQVAQVEAGRCSEVGTLLHHLAQGCAAAGHEVVQVLPGGTDAVREAPWGRVVQVRSPRVPGGDRRVLAATPRLQQLLAALEPDRLELHDRTLQPLGRWARDAGVRAVAVVHDRLDRRLRQRLSGRLPVERLADRANAALRDAVDEVVATSRWAARELGRLPSGPVRVVLPGVDAGTAGPGSPTGLHLVLHGALVRRTRPDLALGAVGELRRRGLDVRLSIVGSGPLQADLRRAAAGLPVAWLGDLHGPSHLARLLGDADALLAPDPAAGLPVRALQALACGTPVVSNVHSGLPEVVGAAGTASASTPRSFADAVEVLLQTPVAEQRARARARALDAPWSGCVEGLLRAHGLPVGPRRAAQPVQPG